MEPGNQSEPEHVGTSTSHRRWRVIGGVVGAVVVALAIALPLTLVSSGASAPKSFTATGTFVLNGEPLRKLDTGFLNTDEADFGANKSTKQCSGLNGYDDISDGAQVTVSDESGTVLALGQLTNGLVVDGACVFTITVPDVPTGHKFYEVAVTHRGHVQYSAQQMRSGKITLSLDDG